MPSAIVVSTAVASSLGFLLNASVLYVVFTRRSRPYHLLFAAILLICALWDGGILLTMVRNSQPLSSTSPNPTWAYPIPGR